MTRRMGYLLLVLALMLSVAVIAGCGDDEDSDTETTQAGAEGQTETTAEGEEQSSDTTEAAMGGDVSGATVYADNCATCHGSDGSGGTGPALINTSLGSDEIETQVRNGAGGMPAFEGDLSDEEIQAVANYVASGLTE